MSYIPINPYPNPVSLAPGAASYPQAPYPQTAGYPGTQGYTGVQAYPGAQGYGGAQGYPGAQGAQAAPPLNRGAAPMPLPPTGASPAQYSGATAASELNRETELSTLATTRTQIIDQRIATRASINQMREGTLLSVIGQAMAQSNALIGADEKWGKDALKNAANAE